MNKKAIEELSEEIIKKAFLKRMDMGIYTPAIDIDFKLIELVDKFKKAVGGIGKLFTVDSNERLPIPEGEYKILNFKTLKNDIEIDVRKEKGKGFRKNFKLSLKKFLKLRHIW